MATKNKSKPLLKPVRVDLRSFLVKPTSKKKKASSLPGIKKGSGGIDSSALAIGVSERFHILAASLHEALEDVTDDPEKVATFEKGASELTADEEMDNLQDQGTAMIRTVAGAHMVFKRRSDLDSFEELWIFPIDHTNPTGTASIEKAILAGTDIPYGSLSSEDGDQRCELWIAGNAKYMHLTGLAN